MNHWIMNVYFVGYPQFVSFKITARIYLLYFPLPKILELYSDITFYLTDKIKSIHVNGISF